MSQGRMGSTGFVAWASNWFEAVFRVFVLGGGSFFSWGVPFLRVAFAFWGSSSLGFLGRSRCVVLAIRRNHLSL